MNQSINRGRYQVDSLLPPKSIEWYKITLSFSDSDHSTNKLWNNLIRKIDTHKVRWDDFYVNSVPHRYQSAGILPLYREHVIAEDWSFSREALFMADTKELYALYHSIDDLQMIAADRCIPLAHKVYNKKDEITRESREHIGVGTRFSRGYPYGKRMEIIVIQFRLFVDLLFAPDWNKVNHLEDLRFIYNWLMRQSESLYNVIHPSRKYKWRFPLLSLPTELTWGEFGGVLLVKRFLRYYYILKMLHGPSIPIHALWDSLIKSFTFQFYSQKDCFVRYLKILVDTVLDNKERKDSDTKYEQELGFLISVPDSFPSYIRLDYYGIRKVESYYEKQLLFDFKNGRIQGEFRNIHNVGRVPKSPQTLKNICTLEMGWMSSLSPSSETEKKLQDPDQVSSDNLFIPGSDFNFLFNPTKVEYTTCLIRQLYRPSLQTFERENILLPIEAYYRRTKKVMERITAFDYNYRKTNN